MNAGVGTGEFIVIEVQYTGIQEKNHRVFGQRATRWNKDGLTGPSVSERVCGVAQMLKKNFISLVQLIKMLKTAVAPKKQDVARP